MNQVGTRGVVDKGGRGEGEIWREVKKEGREMEEGRKKG